MTCSKISVVCTGAAVSPHLSFTSASVTFYLFQHLQASTEEHVVQVMPKLTHNEEACMPMQFWSCQQLQCLRHEQTACGQDLL
jgi:hypothetical protein